MSFVTRPKLCAGAGTACGLGQFFWVLTSVDRSALSAYDYFAMLALCLGLSALLSCAIVLPPWIAGAKLAALATRKIPAWCTEATQASSLWTASTLLAIYLGGATILGAPMIARFREDIALALLIALVQLALLALCLALTGPLRFLFETASRKTPDWPGNPFRRVDASWITIAVAAGLALWVVGATQPHLSGFIPWHKLGFGAISIVMIRAFLRAQDSNKAAATFVRAAAAWLWAPGAIMLAASLIFAGNNAEARFLVLSHSKSVAMAVGIVQLANDFDRDGYGTLLGGNDCAPFNGSIHPGAHDVPDNGIDENCRGGDLSVRSFHSAGAKEDHLPVPDEFQRNWNVLLITVDTLRYDHTSFGGYRDGSKARDTTPELQKLVDRSLSFEFAQAPSAGTMASIPAILTSKYFHSGIALDESLKPPKLKPENLLISELFSSEGFDTGAILSHYYFKNWGMEQGFDSYDNELGKENDPFAVTSPALTDKALTWIAGHSSSQWFLWVHYLDPHGRYVAHPGQEGYGDSEEDLYDGELRFTDAHLGRLFRELSKIPGADRTIVVLTSDHGDGFYEHGFNNHGMALYRELLHVPLIFHIPDAPPRVIKGAVSPLDILPTLADLIGAEFEPDAFEGRSLVPQLFYGVNKTERVVYAETNWPKHLRAAITQNHKLIYQLQNNIYEFYDLQKDPWEKKNLSRNAPAQMGALKGSLDGWLERIYFSRDSLNNQLMFKLKDTLLEQAPTPDHPLNNALLLDGAIKVLGWSMDKRAPAGKKAEISVYYESLKLVESDYKVTLHLVPLSGEAKQKYTESRAKSARKFPGMDLFPSSRWRPGEFVRDSKKLRLPKTWPGDTEAALFLQWTAKGKHTDYPPSPENLRARLGAAVPAGMYLGTVRPLVPLKQLPVPKTPSP